jgi:hypothetical protein
VRGLGSREEAVPPHAAAAPGSGRSRQGGLKPSPAGPTPPDGKNAAATGITDEERQQLTRLLAQKGKTPGAALKTAGCHGASLKDLTREQYQLLVEKLTQLADVPKLPGYVKFLKESRSQTDGRHDF